MIRFIRLFSLTFNNIIDSNVFGRLSLPLMRERIRLCLQYRVDWVIHLIPLCAPLLSSANRLAQHCDRRSANNLILDNHKHGVSSRLTNVLIIADERWW